MARARLEMGAEVQAKEDALGVWTYCLYNGHEPQPDAGSAVTI